MVCWLILMLNILVEIQRNFFWVTFKLHGHGRSSTEFLPSGHKVKCNFDPHCEKLFVWHLLVTQ